MRLSRVARSLVLLLTPFALFVAGCSGSKKSADVTGNVTLDGTALESGRIKFITGKATQDASGEISGGTFKFKAPVGDFPVTIDTTQLQGIPDVKAAQRLLDDVKARKADMEKRGKDMNQGGDTSMFDGQIADAEKTLKQAKDKAAGKLREVPKKYGDEKTSGLTVSVKAGGGELPTIELKSK